MGGDPPSDRRSKPGEHRSTIDVGVLEELIGLEIARFDLPLIGDGTNGGLLDLGDLAAAGLLNGYAAAPGPVTATAASGAVGADGALDLDAGSSTEMAHLDATALLEQLGLDTLTDQIIDELSLGLGAIASRAEAAPDGAELEYMVAGAELRISSPLVGGLTDALAETYETVGGTLEETLNGLVGTGGLIDNALGLLDLPEVDFLGLVRAAVERPVATLDVALPPLQDVLSDEITSEDGLVTIDLNRGSSRWTWPSSSRARRPRTSTVFPPTPPS